MRAFFATESAGGLLLVAACAIALICANSPFRLGYESFWQSSRGFIDSWLMSIFFFLVGLEIKREFLHGEFRNRRAASLPVIAALGGMLTPALIFLAINQGSGTTQGWAVPMPTDIALAIGALSLLGSRIDLSLKIFLLTLAVSDDLGSLIVLGAFYSDDLSISKILSTVGAVLLAWVLPVRKRDALDGAIAAIHPWSSFFVIPIFALANLGLTLNFDSLSTYFTAQVPLGIIVGRVVGKVVGISLFAWLAVKFRIAKLPHSLRFRDIIGASALAGMGLTVSLFIAEIAITDQATSGSNQIWFGCIRDSLRCNRFDLA
ncbi:MAG: Na+/H+ antiporter NhaA [Actinomycetota bacterium]